MNIFMTGSTGYIARALAPVLLERGHSVRGLVRPWSVSKLPPGVTPVVGDALDASTFVEHIAPSDTFIQLVGVAHPSPAKAEQFRRVDLASIHQSVRAAKMTSIAHFIYLSVAMPAPVMKDYIAVREEGERLLRWSGIPSTFAEHVNLMLDILTLAFQTDTTRIASFMFSCEKSGRSYPEIQVGSHHSISHHQGKPDNHAMLTRINTLHMELFARMLGRMAGIWEGETTLLDNVAICYGSAISDGNKHNHDDLPLVVAGGGGGTIKGGRHVVLKKTPICNLFLDFLSRAGVDRKQFGDSTGPLGVLS